MKKLFSFLLSLLLLLPVLGAMAPAALAAGDSEVVITKSPYGEIVTEGEGTFFTAHAYNYTGLIWLIVSPDGETVYENNEAEEAFPGLEMAGFEGEELHLMSIPYALNGWCVQARFLDARGRAALTDMAEITVIRGEVPSPSVTPKSAGARLSPGQSKTLTVEASSSASGACAAGKPAPRSIRRRWPSSIPRRRPHPRRNPRPCPRRRPRPRQTAGEDSALSTGATPLPSRQARS